VRIFDSLAWRRTKKFPILKLDFGAIKSSRQKRFYCGFDGANLKYANIDARKGFCAGDAATGGFARTASEAAVMDDNAHPALSNDDLCAQISTWYFYLFAAPTAPRCVCATQKSICTHKEKVVE
jgi:hypothetical protein